MFLLSVYLFTPYKIKITIKLGRPFRGSTIFDKSWRKTIFQLWKSIAKNSLKKKWIKFFHWRIVTNVTEFGISYIITAFTTITSLRHKSMTDMEFSALLRTKTCKGKHFSTHIYAIVQVHTELTYKNFMRTSVRVMVVVKMFNIYLRLITTLQFLLIFKCIQGQ